MKQICLLGASGSVGYSTLKIIKDNLDFNLIGISIGKNVIRLKEILDEFPSIKYVYLCDDKEKQKLENSYPNKVFFASNEGLNALLEIEKYDLVVNALVGFSGLCPTIRCLELNCDLALANKESLVIGGELIKKKLEVSNSHLYPIDSEHVALWKCLKGRKESEVKKLILTASGGPFRDLSKEQLKDVILKQALNHPSWQMGDKITIDSATMINKAFEIIEAYYLFDIELDKIEVLLHDQSKIHSMVQFIDNSYIADIGPSDMIIPISYALYGGNYHRVDIEPLDLVALGSLTFRKLDLTRYPAIELGLKAIRSKGTMPCVLNAANEAANLAFREGRLPFNKIEEVIEKVMNQHRIIQEYTLEDLIYINRWAYQEAERLIKEEY